MATYQNHTFKTLAAEVGNTVTSTKLVRRSEIGNTNFYGSTQYMKLSSSCASTNNNYCLTTNDVTKTSYASANIYLGYYSDEYSINDNISGSCKFAIGFEDSGSYVNRVITANSLKTETETINITSGNSINPYYYPPIYGEPYVYLPSGYTATIYYSLLIFRPVVTTNNTFWITSSPNYDVTSTSISGNPYADPYLGAGSYSGYSYPNPTSFGSNRVFRANSTVWAYKNGGFGVFFCKCISGSVNITSSDGTTVSNSSESYYYVPLIDKIKNATSDINQDLYNFLKDRGRTGNPFSCTIENGYVQPRSDMNYEATNNVDSYGFFASGTGYKNLPFYGPLLCKGFYGNSYSISRSETNQYTYKYAQNNTQYTYYAGGFGINLSPMSSILFFDCWSASSWSSKMTTATRAEALNTNAAYASSITISSSNPANSPLFGPVLKAVLHIGAVDITPNATAASLKSSGYKYFNFYKAANQTYNSGNTDKKRAMPCRRINFLEKNSYNTTLSDGKYLDGGGYVGTNEPYTVNIW